MTGSSERLTDSSPLCELLDSAAVAVLITTGNAGTPQASVVWFERRDAEIVLFAEIGTAKVRNLEQRPEAMMVVVDSERALAPGVPAYVRLTGTVTVEPGEADLPDRLAAARGNPEGYPFPLRPYCTLRLGIGSIGGVGPFGTRKMGGWLPRTSPEQPGLKPARG